jgi:hypothetical protein
MGLKNAWSLWKLASGWKTAVGAVGSLVTAYLISKGYLGEAEQTLILGVLTLLVGTGVAHKVVKAKQ